MFKELKLDSCFYRLGRSSPHKLFAPRYNETDCNFCYSNLIWREHSVIICLTVKKIRVKDIMFKGLGLNIKIDDA